MDSKIQEITEKIYHDGLEKAEKEAKKILENAISDANLIVKQAKDQAESILAQTHNDIAQLNQKIDSDVKLINSQILYTSRNSLCQLFTVRNLTNVKMDPISDINFIKKLFNQCIIGWNLSENSFDINMIKKEIIDDFVLNLQRSAENGIIFNIEDRITGEFKLEFKENIYTISFNDETFEQLFISFVKPKTKEILKRINSVQ